jgi:hypothetical protein
MRAREFITEQSTQAKLPPEIAEPLRYTYVLPGLSAADPYRNYRFGVAMARARSDMGQDQAEAEKFMPDWKIETAFGEHGMISGFDANVDPVIDRALAMTKTPGGKHLVSTAQSEEPKSVDTVSPIKPFRGYER